jgi:hypothetical protein
VRRLAAVMVLACLALLASGCAEEPASGPTAADYKAERERLLAQMKKNKAKQAQPQPGPEATAPGEPMGESGFGAVAATYSYEKKGKRDPFQPYRHGNLLREDTQGPLMAYELEQLSVVAVVWSTGNRRALVSDPRFIVADESVAALDVSIQADVLNLLNSIQRENGITFLFISHDLSVIAHTCDHVAVMYLGQIVESAPTSKLFSETSHPYTKALLSAIPSLDPDDK